MKQQVEARLEVLRGVLAQRNDALIERQAQARAAVAERDFIVGAIAELEFLLKEDAGDAPEDGKVKGRIPAAQ